MDNDIKILYVEDEAAIRDEMTEILELDIGYLYVAKNGQEGLEMYKQYRPDIIISDVQMPVMDGITMCEEIRKIDPSAEIILTTAFNEKSFIEKAKEAGIERFVSKPVSIIKLFEHIEDCIESMEKGIDTDKEL